MRWAIPEGVVVRVILALAVVGAVYFLVTGVVDALRTYEARQEVKKWEAEVEELRLRQQALESLRQFMQSDEFVEMMARSYLGLVRKGERGIVVISPSPTPAPAAVPEPWWEALLPR
jgi:cell division protein FtsB